MAKRILDHLGLPSTGPPVLRSGAPDEALDTLVHERLDELARAMPDVADKVELGWEFVLEKLSASIATPSGGLRP